jgi:predicted P-loop ATPase
LLNSDFSIPYDPIVDYLDSLPAWDNETDHIKQLAESVKTTNEGFFIKCLYKWLVAMVRSWINTNVVNQTVLVFSGAQGIGKTTWVNNLVPSQLKDYYYSGTINPNNKDTLIHLSECALINLDELENLNRSEIGVLKEIITKGQIRMRRPYGKSAEILPRRASFAGSVNQSQFLNDPTGSRRFLCFEALSFDTQHQINIDLVYSQALALFKSGFIYWFSQDEIKELESNNEQYKSTPMEDELLLQLFEPCNDEEGKCEYLTATDIAGEFNNASNVRVDNGLVNRIGKAATKHNFPRVKKKSIYKYSVKRKTDFESKAYGNDQQGWEVSKA